MKLILVGGNGLADCWGTIGRAIQYMGHETLFIPSRIEKNTNEILLQNYKDYDAILFWNDRNIPACLPEITIPKIYWSVDDFSIWGNLKLLKPFDHIIGCCKFCSEILNQCGKKSSVLYPAVDPDHHYYAYNPDFESKVSLVMTNCYTKQEFPTIFFDRRDLARRLHKDIGGLNLWGKWTGAGWGTSKGCPELGDFYRGFRKYETLAPVFSSSKINISTHVITDHHGYINHRTFEVMGCRGFLMVDKVKGIEEVFEDRKHCVFYENLDDLIEKTRYYLEHEEECKRIAYEGQAYVNSRFSSYEWVRSFEKIVKSL